MIGSRRTRSDIDPSLAWDDAPAAVDWPSGTFGRAQEEASKW